MVIAVAVVQKSECPKNKKKAGKKRKDDPPPRLPPYTPLERILGETFRARFCFDEWIGTWILKATAGRMGQNFILSSYFLGDSPIYSRRSWTGNKRDYGAAVRYLKSEFVETSPRLASVVCGSAIRKARRAFLRHAAQFRTRCRASRLWSR